jgi:intracellular septation protein A
VRLVPAAPTPCAADCTDDASLSMDASTAVAGEEHHRLTIQLPPLRPAILRGGRMLMESAVLPTLAFACFLHLSGLRAALIASLAVVYLSIGFRVIRERHLPGVLMIAAGIGSGRTAIAIATSSTFFYFASPLVTAAITAALFLGSALMGRPVAARIVTDFVHLPDHLRTRLTVRKMFRDVSLIWGLSRAFGALVGLQLLHFGTNAALLARGVIAPIITIAAIALCISWGWRCLSRDGISIQRHRTV